jgi:signal recognition particle receptor subunit beta
MVIYNAATKELTAKIVYYGPGLCGKTTNLKVLHDRLEPGTAGKLLNLQTQTDRTIYFDLLPVELGDIKGYKIRFQLATVPGQTAFNETRRVVLKGVDGIVFVADSQWTMLPKNLESWQNLKDNLKSNEITFESIPVVIQYNKRDLADILAVDAMQEALGLSSYPFVEAVASAGRGVTETFKLISKLTFVDLLRRLQGRRAEEASAAAAAALLPPEEGTHDDLQTWKDSLLNRESQSATPVSRQSRPLSLVPPVPDEAPFDTTELGRGVDEEEEASPYAVPEPLDLDPVEPEERGSSETIPMESVGADFPPAAPEPEVLGEEDEVEIELPGEFEFEPPHDSVTDPAFLPPEPAAAAQAEPLDQPLPETDDRGGRGRSPDARLADAVSALHQRVESTSEHLSNLADRLASAEKGIASLHDAVGSLLQRLVPVEHEISRRPETERTVRVLEAGLKDVDERLRAEANHQRKDADDVAMALRGLMERSQILDQQTTTLVHQVGAHQETLTTLSGLGDRVPQMDSQLAALRETSVRLPDLEGQVAALREASSRFPEIEGQVAALRETASRFAEVETQMSTLRETAARLPEVENQLSGLREAAARLPELDGQLQAALRQHHELESTLEEKTHQGRREAEDIRSQLAPLLEDRVRRHESDASLFAEMERLRESLAESLHDLAERLRHAVRK